ncbi:hypothetical protein B4110_2563 [Parageobacillus toebii]|uniref:Uncharacterized protein n=1 Tax=Parageobacillus toebii TaxID=153151 RepID=A0A150MMZ8_9BACL|nr:hypothetical protein B4110_2563 [Parageobacillus toebii]
MIFSTIIINIVKISLNVHEIFLFLKQENKKASRIHKRRKGE